MALRVALAQSGDRGALDVLLRDHERPLYGHIRTIVGDSDLAFDVLQASMLIVARRLPSLRDPRWFKSWAYRIATREAVREAKRRKRDAAFLDREVAAEDLAAEPPSFDPALVHACADQVDTLPPAARVVVNLHYFDELTLPEVAEALELPLGTVKSRLAYGLARLRSAMSA